MSSPTWVPTVGATDEYRDQEIDLGDGWHAIVWPKENGWGWELWDRWLHDDDDGIVASGTNPHEAGAKFNALDAYEVLS